MELLKKRPRTHELNIRFDFPWDGLRQQGKLLRLRQDSAVRLTYKGEPRQSVKSEARVKEELEIEVEDFAVASAILDRVGFEKRQVYEKYRETLMFDSVEVVLDQMPFGNFVELEGEEEQIREKAKLLGFEWDKRILANYLAIMDDLKKAQNLTFDDLTFENFASVVATAADILPYAC